MDYEWIDLGVYQDKVIQQNTDLNNVEIIVLGTLRIKNAVVNTQNVTFHMSECSKIIVENTSTLNARNTTFTNRAPDVGIDGCDGTFGRWQGIEVWGSYNSALSVVQGRMIMYNSTIKDADIAIFAGKRESGILDETKSGGIVKFQGKNIFENNGNDLIKLPYKQPRQEQPIRNGEFRKLYRGSAGCEPNPFAPIHIIIKENPPQEIIGNIFDGEPGQIIDGILIERVKDVKIIDNTFSENISNGVVLKESKDFTIKQNEFKVKEIAVKTEKSTTLNGSVIKENKFINNRTSIDLLDDNHSKTEISCNKFSYSEYGIHS